MTHLVLKNKKGKDVTTSLIIAEVFGKEHNKVCRDIENLSCSSEFNTANFGVISYIDSRGREQKAFDITKDGFSFLVMGYNGKKASEFKEKFINEFNKRESLLKNDDYIISRAMSVLNDRAKALEQEVERKDERLKLQETVIKTNTPKVKYFNEVLQSESTYTTTQIAKELGFGAPTLNKKLNDLKVQYKQNGTWLLYQKYQTKNYTKTKTYTFSNDDGTQRTSMQTVWTEKGRLFIHSLFKIKTSETSNRIASSI